MKKLLTIILSIALCFSLVIGVSAEGYENQSFSVDFALDGEWTEYDEYNIEFNSEHSQIYIQIMDEDFLGKPTDSTFEKFYDEFKTICDESPDIYSFSEGMLGGLPTFVIDEMDENGDHVGKEAVILTDEFICFIAFSTESGSGEYGYFEAFLNNISLKSSYTGDINFDSVFEYTDNTVASQPDPQTEKEPEKDNTALVIIVVSGISAVALVIIAVLAFKKKK